MGSTAEEAYAEFEEKVKRTVYLDNLSPQVTEPVIKTALNQYGNVAKIQIMPNYLQPNIIAQSALVELKDEKQASRVVETLSSYPFMMSGMPRPVRARHAKPEMFDDRPVNPGRKIKMYWMDPNDPNFNAAQKLKQLTHKHQAEASFLLKHQLEEEQKLSKQQAEALNATYQKLQMMEKVINDGIVDRLAEHYNVKLAGDK